MSTSSSRTEASPYLDLIKSNPKKIIAHGTDWSFLNELKRELKAWIVKAREVSDADDAEQAPGSDHPIGGRCRRNVPRAGSACCGRASRNDLRALVQSSLICSAAPQYAAEELLRAEGFKEIAYIEVARNEVPQAFADGGRFLRHLRGQSH